MRRPEWLQVYIVNSMILDYPFLPLNPTTSFPRGSSRLTDSTVRPVYHDRDMGLEDQILCMSQECPRLMVHGCLVVDLGRFVAEVLR